MRPRHFLAIPSPVSWAFALDGGWSGPDGSSASTDTIFGVRIGKTSRERTDLVYPANLHDWRYHLLRVLWACRDVPLATLRDLQYRADVDYRRGCVRRVRAERGRLLGWLAVPRAWARYRVLRRVGHLAWQMAPEERDGWDASSSSGGGSVSAEPGSPGPS